MPQTRMSVLQSANTNARLAAPGGRQRGSSHDILHERRRNLTKKDIFDKGKNKCIHYGEIYTLYQPVIKKIISRTNCEGKILSKEGDVLVPSTTTADALGIAVARSLNENGIILGGGW